MVGRKKGTPKTGGREKGTPNKRTQYLDRIKASGVDPFNIMLKIANGEVEETEIIKGKDGKPVKVKVPIPWRLRLDACKELAQYLEPKKKAIEITGKDGEQFVSRIERVIVDPDDS